MNIVVDSDVRCAMIEVLQTETGHENIVIGDPAEKTLREAFAAYSIVDETIVAGATFFRTAIADPPPTKIPAESGRPAQRLNWAEPRKKTGSGLRRLGRFFFTFCIAAVTSALVVFASTNGVASTIRMALGSSV